MSLVYAPQQEFVIYMDDESYFAEPRQVGDTVSAHWDGALNYRMIGTKNSSGNPLEH